MTQDQTIAAIVLSASFAVGVTFVGLQVGRDSQVTVQGAGLATSGATSSGVMTADTGSAAPAPAPAFDRDHYFDMLSTIIAPGDTGVVIANMPAGWATSGDVVVPDDEQSWFAIDAVQQDPNDDGTTKVTVTFHSTDAAPHRLYALLGYTHP